MIIFSYLTGFFSYFPGHGQNKSEMNILKGCLDNFSYFYLFLVILFTCQNYPYIRCMLYFLSYLVQLPERWKIQIKLFITNFIYYNFLYLICMLIFRFYFYFFIFNMVLVYHSMSWGGSLEYIRVWLHISLVNPAMFHGLTWERSNQLKLCHYICCWFGIKTQELIELKSLIESVIQMELCNLVLPELFN